MSKAEVDLRAILKLTRDWCREHGYDYVSLRILDGKRGSANTDLREPNCIDISIGYGIDETPTVGAAGESR